MYILARPLTNQIRYPSAISLFGTSERVAIFELAYY